MTQFSTRRRVKHSAADMFDLVADIERYPEFVPLCRSRNRAIARSWSPK
jgi:coenzyme Q-binding protein COQ10